jgi:hypothetical protein
MSNPPPEYILSSSPQTQKLYAATAGRRSAQPPAERETIEKIYADNFRKSKVEYNESLNHLCIGSLESGHGEDEDHQAPPPSMYRPDTLRLQTAGEQAKENFAVLSAHAGKPGFIALKRARSNDFKVVFADSSAAETVLYKGQNLYGTTVRKSFPHKNKMESVTVGISSYQVVTTKKETFARYLVVFGRGGKHGAKQVGVWKRYSDFKRLAVAVGADNNSALCSQSCVPRSLSYGQDGDWEEGEEEDMFSANAVTSWKLLQKRKRWFRCLQTEYLSLKTWLLERFLHDVLYESDNGESLRLFVSGKL